MSCCSGASSSRVFFRTSPSEVAASPTWTDWVPGSVTKSRAASRNSFMRRSMSSARSPTLCSRCNSAKVESIWRMAMTLAVEVMMITASTSMKLPNVSWPIESENDRGGSDFGGVSAVMLLGRAPIGRNIRCISGHGEHAENDEEAGQICRIKRFGTRPWRCLRASRYRCSLPQPGIPVRRRATARTGWRTSRVPPPYRFHPTIPIRPRRPNSGGSCFSIP